MAGHHATPTHSGAAPGGLFITAALVILFVVLFDLGPIAMMGSAAFLLVYASVNAGTCGSTARPAPGRRSSGCR